MEVKPGAASSAAGSHLVSRFHQDAPGAKAQPDNGRWERGVVGRRPELHPEYVAGAGLFPGGCGASPRSELSALPAQRGHLPRPGLSAAARFPHGLCLPAPPAGLGLLGLTGRPAPRGGGPARSRPCARCAAQASPCPPLSSSFRLCPVSGEDWHLAPRGTDLRAESW